MSRYFQQKMLPWCTMCSLSDCLVSVQRPVVPYMCAPSDGRLTDSSMLVHLCCVAGNFLLIESGGGCRARELLFQGQRCPHFHEGRKCHPNERYPHQLHPRVDYGHPTGGSGLQPEHAAGVGRRAVPCESMQYNLRLNHCERWLDECLSGVST